jgi:hypothetical protein
VELEVDRDGTQGTCRLVRGAESGSDAAMDTAVISERNRLCASYARRTEAGRVTAAGQSGVTAMGSYMRIDLFQMIDVYGNIRTYRDDTDRNLPPIGRSTGAESGSVECAVVSRRLGR